MSKIDLDKLERLLAEANLGHLTADAHHRKDYAGRSHGFIRAAGEMAPVAAVVLNVEGMPDDQGIARLNLLTMAANNLPTLLAHSRIVQEIAEYEMPMPEADMLRIIERCRGVVK